ncbi:MAG: histone deacetylase [Halofilum sp. (in: g-proteobacteria)]|nr:histone deacetylase [Halofilum sp. (in: g-proteobacteria)]
MKLFYTDHFVLPLPAGHRFPMDKYRRLRERAQAAPGFELHEPAAATDGQLAMAHDRGYIAQVAAGTLDPRQVRALGFPWSPGLVERSRRSNGATIAAARAALADGAAGNLAGGTHHAQIAAAQGFCVFNDCAVAARVLQREGRIRRALVVDTDVHQGNGTAQILAGDESVFTFSIHGARNFPVRKEPGDLDVALEDGTTDGPYLEALDAALDAAFARARPDLVFYLAGADPYEHDRLGRLALTRAGLAERDRRVVARCAAAGLPVAVVMGGGYAPEIDDIVDIHFASIERVATLAGRSPTAAREGAPPGRRPGAGVADA